MRKIICILGLALMMTGCSSNFEEAKDYGTLAPEKGISIAEDNEKAIYIEDDMKELIKDINNLREKHEDTFDRDSYEDDYEYLYIDVHNARNNNVSFNNKMFTTEDYFTDLVEILDTSIAKGLKEHVEEMKTKEIEANEIILRKIGRVVIYTEDEGQDGDNFISLKINFSDLRDKDYKKAFEEISQDKYILDNVIMGDKQNMISFVNSSSFYSTYYYDKDYLNVKYNMFLGDKDIEKVNILMEGNSGATVTAEDMDVFTNLLDRLGINGEDRELLVKTYEDILKTKSNNKEIVLENYKLLINFNKEGIRGFNSGYNRKLVYFSLEKAKASEL